MRIEAEDILKETNGGLDIILNLYPDASQSVHQPNRKFKTRDEKTASAKLNRLDNGTYLVIDFGNDQKNMNAILCYQLEQGCDYPTAINELAIEYNVSGSEALQSTIKHDYSDRPAESTELENAWSYEVRENFNEIEIETIISTNLLKSLKWKSKDEKEHAAAFKKIESTLKEYHFHPVISYSIVKNRKVMTFSANDKYPIFLIDEAGDNKERFQKIYQPKHEDKSKRFLYIPGKKPANFIHGLQQLYIAQDEHRTRLEDKRAAQLEKGETVKELTDEDFKLKEVILCTGGSDAINVALCGYHVIWLNSESAILGQYKYDEIAKIVQRFYNLGDIDQTGREQRHKLCMQYLDIYDIELPNELMRHTDKRKNPCKDVRDYLNHYKRKEFKLLVEFSAMPYRFWDKKMTFNKSGGFAGFEYKFRNEFCYNFLQKNGFYRLPVGDKESDFEYIQIEGNVVRISTPIKVKAFIKNFLRDRHMDHDLRDAMHKTAQLNDSSLTSLDEIDIDFIDNDKHTQFLFFENKTLEVTASGIKEYLPGKVRRFVWADDVYPHRWKMPEEPPFIITKNEIGDYDIEIKNTECLFLKYLIQTSRAHWRVELEERLPKSTMTGAEKEQYLITNQFNIAGPLLNDDEILDQKRHLVNKLFSIGYLLHRYKDRSKAWFFFAMDGKVNEDGQSHGGSGKSILFDVAMKQLLRKHFMLSGRNVKLTDDPHKYDGLTEHHRYLFIDDAHQYLKLDAFYSDVTGDMKVNPKGKKPYVIPFEVSAKMSFSSNYTPQNLGPSTERRMVYNVFSDYYHSMGETTDYKESRDPSTEFGKEMFKQFDQKDYQNFFSTAVFALKFYLGTTEKISPAMGNVNRRNLMNKMGDVFYDWAKVYFSEEGDKVDVFFPREEPFQEYLAKYNPQKFTAHSFKTKLEAFCKIEGYILNPKKYQGPKGNIIQKFDRRAYDKRNNVWTVVDPKKVSTEMFYIQTKHDLPEGIGEEDGITPGQRVERRMAEITKQSEITFNPSKAEPEGDLDKF